MIFLLPGFLRSIDIFGFCVINFLIFSDFLPRKFLMVVKKYLEVSLSFPVLHIKTKSRKFTASLKKKTNTQ